MPAKTSEPQRQAADQNYRQWYRTADETAVQVFRRGFNNPACYRRSGGDYRSADHGVPDANRASRQVLIGTFDCAVARETVRADFASAIFRVVVSWVRNQGDYRSADHGVPDANRASRQVLIGTFDCAVAREAVRADFASAIFRVVVSWVRNQFCPVLHRVREAQVGGGDIGGYTGAGAGDGGDVEGSAWSVD
jgi:hypothetical protein